MSASPQTYTLMIPDAHGGKEHAVEVCEKGTEQFVARLRKVAKERRKWARKEGISCYRIYDADLPDYAVAIDIYEGFSREGQALGESYIHIAEYQAPSSVDPDRAARRFADVIAVSPAALGVQSDHVFAKVRQKAKGGAQYREAGSKNFVSYTLEDGHLFKIDLGGYLDTGIFLDHRITRIMVGKMAKGKRFLNLFAYTGTATVHAAAGGAVSTKTVDLSQTYLEWAQQNMALNGFAGKEHSFVRADVLQWLVEALKAKETYDLIFIDPPTFSNSKAMGKRTWDVQRDHVVVLRAVAALLSPGGQAVFSCNLRSFKPDEGALKEAGIVLEDITAKTIPEDFTRNPKIHKCYLLTLP